MAAEAVLSAEELAILQELLNIAFGEASAALAARLHGALTLSVPDVQAMPGVLLRYYVGAELKGAPRALAVVEQGFQGDLAGRAVLVLPSAAIPALLPLVADGARAGAAPDALAREVLAEAARVLAGTCLARLAGLLGTTMTCTPPAVALDAQRTAVLQTDLDQAAQPAVVLRGAFDLGSPELRGFLFLAGTAASIRWLGPALHRFMAQYGRG